MHIDLVFETHSTTVDNEDGIATGWNPGRLSPRTAGTRRPARGRTGREQARQLGERRRGDGLSVIFTSDLARALETVAIAFGDVDIPVLHDWRLRECNYGLMNGTAVSELRHEEHIDVPYPSGESWREAIARVGGFLHGLGPWRGQRLLVVGHMATHWALDHFVHGTPIEALISMPFSWQEGWEYRVPLA